MAKVTKIITTKQEVIDYYICDRCKTSTETVVEIDIWKYNSDGNDISITYDFCHGCYLSFGIWLEDANT